jgi:hypothetical protein
VKTYIIRRGAPPPDPPPLLEGTVGDGSGLQNMQPIEGIRRCEARIPTVSKRSV